MERAAEKEPASNQRAMMAELDAAQRKRHKAEWRVLDQTYSAERKGVLEKFQSVKALTAAHLRERQAKETALYNCQTQELTNFARRGRGLVGRVRLAIETAREQRTPGDGQLSFAGQVIGFALSPQKILEIFERRHHVARAAFAR
jgi:hypothetical protein